MRTIPIVFISALLTFQCLAQEKGKTRFGFETGLLVPNEGGFGLSAALESKYNIQNNMNIGLRAETSGYFKHKSYSANLFSLSVMYDYYFLRDKRSICPYVGMGIGYFMIEATDISTDSRDAMHSVYYNPAVFLRLGTELGKFRISLTYSFNRKPNEVNVDNRNNDNVSLLLGFYLGGGNWK